MLRKFQIRGVFGVTFIEQGYITKLIEKPDDDISNLAMIGLYYVRDAQQLMRAIETMMDRNIQTKGEFYLTDAFQIMIDGGARFTAESVEVWEDCGTKETVLQTNRYLLGHGRAHGRSIDGSIVIPPVYIDDSATVTNSIVGPHVSIAAGAVVSNSIVRDSIINQDALIESTTLQNSLVGDDARGARRFSRAERRRCVGNPVWKNRVMLDFSLRQQLSHRYNLLSRAEAI